jgi:hypothetical protein
MLSFNTFRDLHDKITSIISPEHTQIWGGIDLVTTQGSWERFGEPRSQSITCTPFLPVPMEPSCHTLYDQVFSVMEIRNCVAFHFRLFLPAPFVFFILHIGLLYQFILLCYLSPALSKQVYVFRWLLSTKPRLLSSRTCFPDLPSTANIGAPLLRTRQRRRRLLYTRAILFWIEVQSIQNWNLEYLGLAIPLTHGS